MRTIKFRGYNRKNGEWLYGFYLQNRGQHFVCPDEFATGKTWEDYEIDPKTLGQFTGVKDANGAPIYEGDIIRRPSSNRYYMVKFDMDFFPVFALFYSIGGNIHFADYLKVDYADTYEVVGNIYDNPELVTNDF